MKITRVDDIIVPSGNSNEMHKSSGYGVMHYKAVRLFWQNGLHEFLPKIKENPGNRRK